MTEFLFQGNVNVTNKFLPLCKDFLDRWSLITFIDLKTLNEINEYLSDN